MYTPSSPRLHRQPRSVCEVVSREKDVPCHLSEIQPSSKMAHSLLGQRAFLLHTLTSHFSQRLLHPPVVAGTNAMTVSRAFSWLHAHKRSLCFPGGWGHVSDVALLFTAPSAILSLHSAPDTCSRTSHHSFYPQASANSPQLGSEVCFPIFKFWMEICQYNRTF